ncbi:hypothetical protein PVA45_04510 [Entomospira entomophila]|uniref:Uncharacterized protein n=1 Tax=Entomospira entomophila TaxID=2719988 RepID=A0A968G900_9SPIO|nr:hypothetical protein [Entomospira entomophilus]NIZ40767.1 hypothetical protein [Entomospira entomophilus]WDI34980.1 hypothetical protein PVA45_04510 [Entomospira entomophilus]
MIDVILLKIKKHMDLHDEEQELIFLEAIDRFIKNQDVIAQPFIKLNIEHLISGYIAENDYMSQSFIDNLANITVDSATLTVQHQADTIYFIVRYLLAKRKEKTATRYCVLFLHDLTDTQRRSIDKLTLDYLEYFATYKKNSIESSDSEKTSMAGVYSGLEKFSSREILTPEFLENPFHPHFAEYDVAIHRILAMSSLAQNNQS